MKKRGFTIIELLLNLFFILFLSMLVLSLFYFMFNFFSKYKRYSDKIVELAYLHEVLGSTFHSIIEIKRVTPRNLSFIDKDYNDRTVKFEDNIIVIQNNTLKAEKRYRLKYITNCKLAINKVNYSFCYITIYFRINTQNQHLFYLIPVRNNLKGYKDGTLLF